MATMHYGKVCVLPAVQGTPAVDIRGVTFQYPGAEKPALKDVSLTIQVGERVAMVGPNGAGKSTLIKLLASLETLQEGEITIHGHRVGECRHRVAYVPQRGDVDWRFPVTVHQVVMMGRYVHVGWLKRPRPEDHEAVAHAMELMGITDLADRQIGELSGGQQQRVMLARTLAHRADLLLLDEPLNNLDVVNQEMIFDVMDTLSTEGRTIVVTTHDLGALPMHFSRAVFLDQTVVAEGPVNEVITPQTLLRAYGVHIHSHEGIDDVVD